MNRPGEAQTRSSWMPRSAALAHSERRAPLLESSSTWLTIVLVELVISGLILVVAMHW